ncbi:hypothetical protein [Nostoc sp. NMS4]|uniref:hypothetical protein n=1 Tax=Nostoc sp. NMS4 TaxID=2815390 RepID=UPI0025F931F9|nr:hypothetical protein [Nostoc sp. NMS4]MBN3927819.1 hypothetical protein [Nostoc sp. NMS4]
MKIKWRSHLKPKPKKRRPSSEEDILHLRRTGRYIPPPRKSWRDKFYDNEFRAKLGLPAEPMK